MSEGINEVGKVPASIWGPHTKSASLGSVGPVGLEDVPPEGVASALGPNSNCPAAPPEASVVTVSPILYQLLGKGFTKVSIVGSAELPFVNSFAPVVKLTINVARPLNAVFPADKNAYVAPADFT